MRLPEEDYVRLLKCCDLLLWPSKYEGFGFPPLEAMCHHVRCVVVDSAINRELYGGAINMVQNSDSEIEFKVAIEKALFSDSNTKGADFLVRKYESYENYSESLFNYLIA